MRLLFGIQSWWWSTGSLRHPCGVSVGPPEGEVAPGTDWVGLLPQPGQWATVAWCRAQGSPQHPSQLTDTSRASSEWSLEREQSVWMDGGGLRSWALACEDDLRTRMLKEKSWIPFSAPCWNTREEGAQSSRAQEPSSLCPS